MKINKTTDKGIEMLIFHPHGEEGKKKLISLIEEGWGICGEVKNGFSTRNW